MRTPLLAGAAALVLLTGCRANVPQTELAAPPTVDVGATPVVVAPPAATPAGVVPSPSGSPSASTSASPSASPATVTATYDVRAVQASLSALHYYVGQVDGQRGSALSSAVMAFQKVQGLSADGAVGPATMAALKHPRLPALRASSPASRVEVDLTRQVLYVVRGGAVTRILPVSSGSGRTYRQKNGEEARALTPVGWYTIGRRIVGTRTADLGKLYDPEYFYRGWAIHGSDSVPAHPASHGCVRVTRADGTWLLGQIGVGTQVYLYGGTHVFTAGSTAPGTNDPTGDTPADAPSSPKPPAPSATAVSPAPTSKPASTPAPRPTTTPSPTASPTPTSKPSGTPRPTSTSTP